MTKITEFADGVSDLNEIEDLFGALSDRKRVVLEKGREVAGRWNDHLSNQLKSIAVTEAAINRLSNVPLTPSKDSPPPAEPPSFRGDGKGGA